METKPVRLVLVGLGGYAGYCYDLIKQYIPASRCVLCGVVDPVAEKAPLYPDVIQRGIPVYPDLEAFFKEQKADLALIASPIPYHCEQAVTCMQNGAHVLCEKPIAATMQDCEIMEQAAKDTGKLLGVGFQWSFADPVLQAKRDVLAGRYGKPLRLKVLVSWKRYDDYYQNGWKGCVADRQGRWILDTVASNATAHYLHNMYFMLGDRLETSAMPDRLEAMVLRAKDIETYDTCLLKGQCAGAELLYYVTHAGDESREPTLVYEFEKGKITMNLQEPATVWYGEIDGEQITYGEAQGSPVVAQKIEKMLDAIQYGAPLPCVPETVKPHLVTVNLLMERCPIHRITEHLYREEDKGTFVKGLFDQLWTCFEENRLPTEGEWDWVPAPTLLEPAGYREFTGVRHD